MATASLTDLDARAERLLDACTPSERALLYRGGWGVARDEAVEVLGRLGAAAFLWSLRTTYAILCPPPYDSELIAFVSDAFSEDLDVSAALLGMLASDDGAIERARVHIHDALIASPRALDDAAVEAALAEAGEDYSPCLELLKVLALRESVDARSVCDRALEASDAPRRELAAAMLSARSPDYARAQGLRRIASRKKASRLTGCALLSGLTIQDDDMQVLRGALERERTADVSHALSELITRADADADTKSWAEDLLAERRRGRLPAFVDPKKLGAMRWREGGELTERERTSLLLLLKKEDDRDEVSSLRRLRPRLDDADCARWSERLERAWAKAGYPAPHKWAVYQIGVLGDDARVDAIALELPEFARNNNWSRATWYLGAFSRLGSDRALSWLLDLFCTTDRGSIHSHTQRLLNTHRPTDPTAPALEERLDPYVRQVWRERDLKAPPLTPGEATLSTNMRTFTVLMDRELRLVLRDDEGARYTDKIPLAKGEQKATRDAVLKEIKALRQKVDAFVEVWRGHLEEAMVSARPFELGHLRERFLSDPVMAKLIETLVWRTSEGATLRFADGESIDADFEPVELPSDARLVLAHPLELTPAQRSSWTTHLVDAELSQVFLQMARPIYTRGAHPVEERCGGEELLAYRFEDALERSGWSRSGTLTFTSRRARACVTLSDSHHAVAYHARRSFLAGLGEVTFTDLWYDRTPPNEVDPVVYSETYYGITRLFDVSAGYIARSRR